MISLKERKLALLIQTEHLKRHLGSLRQQDGKEAQPRTYADRRAYVDLVDLVESLDSKET